MQDYREILAQGKAIILFDGVCNLCNGFVNFVIDRDKKNTFYFAALQSDFGTYVREKYRLSVGGNELESIVLLKGEKVHTYSDAVLRICKGFTGPLRLLYAFIIIPKFIRDAVYKLIARNRYNWFGRQDSCRVPTPELINKFITDQY